MAAALLARSAWGAPITMAFAAVLAGPLLGMSAGAALMLGAILVVSGPTVVGPLLAFVRPSDRLQRILSWEGSLIDPVGGILGAVVFHAVLASTSGGIGHPLGQFLLSFGIGAAGALVGVAVLWLCLCKLELDEVLATTAQLACVVGVAAACDIVRDDAGLIAAVLMGLAVANLRAFHVPDRRPFFETPPPSPPPRRCHRRPLAHRRRRLQRPGRHHPGGQLRNPGLPATSQPIRRGVLLYPPGKLFSPLPSPTRP